MRYDHKFSALRLGGFGKCTERWTKARQPSWVHNRYTYCALGEWSDYTIPIVPLIQTLEVRTTSRKTTYSGGGRFARTEDG